MPPDCSVVEPVVRPGVLLCSSPGPALAGMTATTSVLPAARQADGRRMCLARIKNKEVLATLEGEKLQLMLANVVKELQTWLLDFQ